MPSDSFFSDKTTFIVAFFAGFIALSFHSDFFNAIELFFGTHEYSSIQIFNVMLTTLFISVYFFAIDYIKPESSYRLKFFSYFKWIGNFFYAFTLIILPISLIVHGISYILINLNIKTEFLSLIFGIISGIIVSLISGRWSRRISRSDKEEAVSAIQLKEENAIKQAEELYKGDYYSAALVEMGKLIEIAMQKTLLQKKNIDVKRASFFQLIEIALKTELIDSKMAGSIKEIRNMRNKAAHLDFEFKKEDAEWALNETNRILQKLDPKAQWS